jgi:hypothetical protein
MANITMIRAQYDSLLAAAKQGDPEAAAALQALIDEANGIVRYILQIRWQDVGGKQPPRIELGKAWPPNQTYRLELERRIVLSQYLTAIQVRRAAIPRRSRVDVQQLGREVSPRDALVACCPFRAVESFGPPGTKPRLLREDLAAVDDIDIHGLRPPFVIQENNLDQGIELLEKCWRAAPSFRLPKRPCLRAAPPGRPDRGRQRAQPAVGPTTWKQRCALRRRFRAEPTAAAE